MKNTAPRVGHHRRPCPGVRFEKICRCRESHPRLGITYPVAMEQPVRHLECVKNEYLARALPDRRTGKNRHQHFGEGAYQETSR